MIAAGTPLLSAPYRNRQRGLLAQLTIAIGFSLGWRDVAQGNGEIDSLMRSIDLSHP